MRSILLSCLLLCSLYSATGKVPTTHKIRLTENWEYLKGDLGGIWEAVRPANPGNPETVPLWEKVTLPHCFNAEDAVDPDVNYYQGAGWYKTLLDIENPYADGRVLLDFEGAGQKTEVYLYTTKVGEHIGGYDEWTLDITDAVEAFKKDKGLTERFGGKIPLSIRCDNSRDLEMIPSDLSDFNVYGGLYRYVNLVYVPKTSFQYIQLDAGLSTSLKEGILTINASFHNPADIKKANIQVTVYDPNKKIVFNKQLQDILPLGKQFITEISIKNPILWDVDNPNLYTCELKLDVEGESVTAKECFGFRHFEFKEKGPFYLNGKRLLLRGTHRHEDHAGVGQAMTEAMMRTEIEMMKRMGVNFIRLGHYQQSEIILNLCDELGILVWEEIPWCRGGLGGESYKIQARRMLTNMVTQHRNHPSVIIWGLGNENDWPNDFSYFEKDAIRAFMKELHDLAHQLDNSRKTAIRRCEFCSDIVDVYSPSIWAGWYRGVYTEYKDVSHTEMQKVNHFLHVEWGGDSHARRHAENIFENLQNIVSGQGADERAGDASLYGGAARVSKDGDWSESYICDLIDWHLKEQETMPWLTGAAYWPFKDFSTPVRPENPVPYMNQKGVIERDFTPKESYYVFQSYWTEKPMIHIYGHSWPVRWGKANEKKMMKVYSNCEEVELFVNGESLGKQKRNSQDFPAAGLRWESVFKSGTNTIKAIGKKGKERVEDEITFEYETRTFGSPTQLTASIIEETDEYVWIEAALIDENGVVSLTSRDYIYFDSVGDGHLIINRGTSSGSKKVQAYNGRARIKLIKNKGKNIVAIKGDRINSIFIPVE
ncbi:glycoside hydrolase family 2 TIM barrel-domain containing protein [Parabacteroides sp. PF5-9]|uniref:glycoside hydrolase family 2 protein n=1 Tax=Parabacteroides sp. PF5-9 TaxID=1742404 RepID=UPI0024734E44|nr:glycoside hydrolase family 2 TIM barrel-domain containing protein [Parabacteroides sp. PF5-9]